jgi:hypothetical protein
MQMVTFYDDKGIPVYVAPEHVTCVKSYPNEPDQYAMIYVIGMGANSPVIIRGTAERVVVHLGGGQQALGRSLAPLVLKSDRPAIEDESEQQ